LGFFIGELLGAGASSLPVVQSTRTRRVFEIPRDFSM
jgi:hypothetical protein